MPRRSSIRLLAQKVAKEVAAGSPANHPIRHMVAREGFLYLPLAVIRANPDQPRKEFDEESLNELTRSVADKGVLQPILVRKDPEREGYIIIAGERRWRAAKRAGLEEVPALIRTGEDQLEVALIENLQRENLTPLEEAEALLKLKIAKRYTDEDLARVIGKSRKAVNETLLLNQLPEPIKAEWRTSAIGSKSQLLQVLRGGSPEKVKATWEALKTGEARTVRDLRKRKVGPQSGRPKHVRLEYAPKGKSYRLTLTFSKKSATRTEVRSALKAALKDMPKQLHG